MHRSLGQACSMRRSKAPPSACMPKDRRRTCAWRVRPHLPRCCMTSYSIAASADRQSQRMVRGSCRSAFTISTSRPSHTASEIRRRGPSPQRRKSRRTIGSTVSWQPRPSFVAARPLAEAPWLSRVQCEFLSGVCRIAACSDPPGP